MISPVGWLDTVAMLPLGDLAWQTGKVDQIEGKAAGALQGGGPWVVCAFEYRNHSKGPGSMPLEPELVDSKVSVKDDLALNALGGGLWGLVGHDLSVVQEGLMQDDGWGAGACAGAIGQRQEAQIGHACVAVVGDVQLSAVSHYFIEG